jgi:excinuclease ABC subunit C
LHAIEAIRAEQRVVQTGAALHVSMDVVGIHREGDLAEIVVLYVRDGRVSDTANFSFQGAELETTELVAAFVAQHYAPPTEGGAAPPDEILLPCGLEAMEGVAELLTERKESKVQLLVPQRGARAHLVQMANDNASHVYRQKRRESENVEERLEQLRHRLRLPTLPKRIECCDISHLGGGDTVGAIVAMLDGAPDSKRYKSFHVRGVRDGDDYGAMYEVLARRFRRGRAVAEAKLQNDDGEPTDAQPQNATSDQVDWDLPDLFVVDGGRGQLAVALAAAHDLGLHQLPIVALAKEKDLGDRQVVDRVYLPNQKNPINLKEHSASLFFLARARDEAHRFANKAREKLGARRRLRSGIDAFKGLGAQMKKELLRTLGSLRAIEAADDATLLAVPGFTKRHLAAIRKIVPTPKGELGTRN